MKALEIITDGFEDLEAIGTSALLRRGGMDLTIAAIDSTKAVGSYGASLENLVDWRTLDFDEFDLLVIPGGPEHVAEEKDPRFLKMIEHFHSHDKYIAAICAAPTILGHMGYLKGKNYTCFTSMNEDFGGTFHDVYSIVDGKLITGKSCAGTIDFALNILKTCLGDEAEKKVKERIYY